MDYSLLLAVGTCSATALAAERAARAPSGHGSAGVAAVAEKAILPVSYWEAQLGGVAALADGPAQRDRLASFAAEATEAAEAAAAALGGEAAGSDDDETAGPGGGGGGGGGGFLGFLDEGALLDDEAEAGGEREWYRFGIIDILQRFNARKQAESVLKVPLRRAFPLSLARLLYESLVPTKLQPEPLPPLYQ